jgi:hypothetical protein
LRGRLREYLNSLEQRGIIGPSNSQWRNPIRAIEKPNSDVRLTSNLMGLNDLAKKDTYRLSNMRRIIERMAGSKWFLVIDLGEGYYQIEIEEQHKHKTTFEFEHKATRRKSTKGGS